MTKHKLSKKTMNEILTMISESSSFISIGLDNRMDDDDTIDALNSIIFLAKSLKRSIENNIND